MGGLCISILESDLYESSKVFCQQTKSSYLHYNHEIRKKEIVTFIEHKDPLVEFMKAKQTAKSSPFWSSFSQVFYNKIKQVVIRCDKCGTILIHKSIDGTKVMSSHTKACEKKKQLNAYHQSTDIRLQTNSTSRPMKIPSHIKQLVTDASVEFAFLDNRPFETIRGDGFVNLVEKILVAGQQLSGLTGAQVKDLLPDPTTVSR